MEADRNKGNKNSPKKFLLNSKKIKDRNTTANRIPSCVSTSQEYQIENKFPKSKSSQKNNKPKNDFIIFTNFLEKKIQSIQKNPTNPIKQKNNVKKILSVDKIGKNNNNTKSFIENNLYKKENVKNEMKEIIQNFVDNNLQNNKKL